MDDDDQEKLAFQNNIDNINGDDQDDLVDKEDDSNKKLKENSAAKESEPPKFLVYKILKQLTLIGVWISLGSFLEIIGPTLTDLKDNIGVNYEEISRCLLVKSVGFFIGSIIGGFAHERFYKQTDLIMSIGTFIGAIGVTLCPVVNNLPLLSIMMGLTGISEGLINTGGNTMVMHLWGMKAASPMCSLHLGFGIGALSVPQIAAPFLAQEINTTDTLESQLVFNNSQNIEPYTLNLPLDTTTSSLIDGNLTDNYSMFKVSNLVVPYSIVGAYTTFFAVLMLIFFIVGPPKGFPRRKGIKNFLKLVNPAQCGYGSGCYGLMMLCLLFIYYIQTVGGERAYGKYIASYSLLNEVKFTKQQSANLASVFWLCHMCGRLLGILFSFWVPLVVIMIVFITGSTIESIILSIFGHDTAIVLWIFTGLMGLTISLAFPSGMSWANLHMKVNSVAVMVLLMGGACGGFIYQYLPGYLFEYVGHRTLMYVMVAYALLLGVNFIIMEVVARKIGKPIEKDYNKKELDKEAVELKVMVNNST